MNCTACNSKRLNIKKAGPNDLTVDCVACGHAAIYFRDEKPKVVPPTTNYQYQSLPFEALPLRYRNHVTAWIMENQAPEKDGVLHEILRNNLMMLVTVLKDDLKSFDVDHWVDIIDVVHWMYEHAPNACWGSWEWVQRWASEKGTT